MPLFPRIPLPDESISSDSNITTIEASNTPITLLESNEDRKIATITNTSSVPLYLALGGTADFEAYTVQLMSGDYYEVPGRFTGEINGIWTSAVGGCLVTELT